MKPHRLVFIDETSTNTKMTRLRGRAPCGERLKAPAPFGRWGTQTFIAGLRIGGDQRHEEPAVVDPFTDLPVPGVPAAQLALVEPDFNSRGPQRGTDACRRLRVLRGIADENCPRRLSHDGSTLT